MIDKTDLALMDELPGTGEFEKLQPFRLNRVFHKGDNEVEETKDQKAFADVTAQKWNHYKEKYSGLEQEYMDRVDSMDSEGAMDFAKGSSNQHTQAEFSKASDDVRESHNKAGLNPNSGASKAKMADFSSSEGASTGENMTRAGNSQKDQHITGVENLVAMGQGKSTTATAGLSGLADSSAEKASSDAFNAFNESAANQEAIGTVGGATAKHYGLGESKPSGYSMDTQPLPENNNASLNQNWGQGTT